MVFEKLKLKSSNQVGCATSDRYRQRQPHSIGSLIPRVKAVVYEWTTDKAWRAGTRDNP